MIPQNSSPPAEEWITVAEAAYLSGLSPTTLRTSILAGKIPGEVRLVYETGRDLPTRLRKSGGGPVLLLQRGPLHDYLAHRKSGPIIPLPAHYPTPAGKRPIEPRTRLGPPWPRRRRSA